MNDRLCPRSTGDELRPALSCNSDVLASALRKLHMGAQNIPLQVSDATANSTTHIFIVNPLTGKGLASLFSTHSGMEERIARLEAMSKDMSYMRA